MDLKEIKLLLEKYYNGESSLQEEDTLLKYFSRKDIPEDLFKEKAIFLNIKEERQHKRDTAFEQEVWTKITEFESTRKSQMKKMTIHYITRIAASLVILFGIYFMFQQQFKFLKPDNQLEDTYNDPQLAYAEFKKTMMYVSTKFNKGTNHLESLEKFDKASTELNQITKFSKGMDELNPVMKMKLGVKYLN